MNKEEQEWYIFGAKLAKEMVLMYLENAARYENDTGEPFWTDAERRRMHEAAIQKRSFQADKETDQ